MRVRFEFEIDEDASEEIDAWDVMHCGSIEELEQTILDWPQANWRVFVNKSDLSALWEAVQKAKSESAE